MRRGQPSYADRAYGLHPNRVHPCDICPTERDAHPDTIAAALAAAKQAATTARHKLDTEARARVERGAKP